jgi:hypothetical protein
MPEEKGSQVTFTFRNQALLDLYKEEFCGQLSDGLYENAFHGVHSNDWQYMTECHMILGSETKLVGIPNHIHTKSQFARLFKDVPEIADRDLIIIQRTEPTATMKTLYKYTSEISKAIRTRTQS